VLVFSTPPIEKHEKRTSRFGVLRLPTSNCRLLRIFELLGGQKSIVFGTLFGDLQTTSILRGSWTNSDCQSDQKTHDFRVEKCNDCVEHECWILTISGRLATDWLQVIALRGLMFLGLQVWWFSDSQKQSNINNSWLAIRDCQLTKSCEPHFHQTHFHQTSLPPNSLNSKTNFTRDLQSIFPLIQSKRELIVINQSIDLDWLIQLSIICNPIAKVVNSNRFCQFDCNKLIKVKKITQKPLFCHFLSIYWPQLQSGGSIQLDPPPNWLGVPNLQSAKSPSKGGYLARFWRFFAKGAPRSTFRSIGGGPWLQSAGIWADWLTEKALFDWNALELPIRGRFQSKKWPFGQIWQSDCHLSHFSW